MRNLNLEAKFEESSIITTHALSVMVKYMPDLDAQLGVIRADAARHECYPDGSIFIEGKNSTDRLWKLILAKGLLAKGVCQPNGFGSIEPFPNTHYRLYYTYDYSESLEDLGFVITGPGAWKTGPADYKLSNLLISVGFIKSPPDEIKYRFVASLREWFQSVSVKGLFEEGPIKLVSSELEFRGRLVQFRIDASQSGQHTLNWLLIHTLNFAYSSIPITDFIFDHEGQVIKALGHISKKVQKISLAVP